MLPTRANHWPSSMPPYTSTTTRSERVGRRRAAAWDLTCLASSLSLVLVSLVVWAGIRKHSAEGTSVAASGQIVCAWCLLLGIVGTVSAGHPAKATRGVSMKGLVVRSGLLIGLVVALIGTVGFTAEVKHEMRTNCVLAEAAVRIRHLEDTVTKLKHDELMTQVFFRLNELDDLLSAAADSSTAHATLHTEAFHLHHQDRAMISERVSRLRRHADALLVDMRAQVDRSRVELRNFERNVSQDADQGPTTSFAEYEVRRQRLQDMAEERKHKEEALWLLEKRVEAVDSVVQYLEARSHDAHRDLTFEEYEIILKALLDGSAPASPQADAPKPAADAGNIRITYHTPSSPDLEPVSGATPRLTVLREALDRDHATVSSTKAAFERRNAPGTDLLGDPRARAIHELRAKQEAARRDFEGRFFNVFEEGAGHLEPGRFNSAVTSALDNVPAHCLKGEDASRALRFIARLLMIAQVAVAFTVSTVLAAGLSAAKDE